jgi:hypothetical protein
MVLQPFVGPWPLFQFLNAYTVGRTPWTGDQPVASPLLTHRTTQTQNKRTQTSLPWARFEHTIQAFQRAKTVYVSDCAAILIGGFCIYIYIYICDRQKCREYMPLLYIMISYVCVCKYILVPSNSSCENLYHRILNASCHLSLLIHWLTDKLMQLNHRRLWNP